MRDPEATAGGALILVAGFVLGFLFLLLIWAIASTFAAFRG